MNGVQVPFAKPLGVKQSRVSWVMDRMGLGDPLGSNPIS